MDKIEEIQKELDKLYIKRLYLDKNKEEYRQWKKEIYEKIEQLKGVQNAIN